MAQILIQEPCVKDSVHNISDTTTSHVISRCSNNEFLFRKDEDFVRYKNILAMAKKKFRFVVNNYTLMNNHCHLMLTLTGNEGLGPLMRWLNGIYSKDYNRRHGRSSHFWKARYNSKTILEDSYALGCLRYQHRNPLRAGMVGNPEHWPWSGYACLALGKEDPLITAHPSYLALSDDPIERLLLYRRFVNTVMPFDHRGKEIFSPPKRGRPKKMGDFVERIALPTIQLACRPG